MIGMNETLEIFPDGDSYVFVFRDSEGNVSCHSVLSESIADVIEKLYYLVGDCV